MYFGETQIFKDRINDFVSVANDLGVKDISEEQDEDDVPEAAEEPEDESPDTHTVPEFESEEQIIVKKDIKEQESLNQDKTVMQKRKQNMLKKDGKLYCVQCDYVTGRYQSGSMLDHIKFKHEGIGYPCDQCAYKGPTKVTNIFITIPRFNGIV